METVKVLNKDLTGQAVAASLLDKLSRQEADKLVAETMATTG